MHIKEIFAGRSALYQLMTLLVLILLFAILSSVLLIGIVSVSSKFTHGAGLNLYESPDLMRFTQFITSLGTFLIPALGVAWLCSPEFKKYLFIGKCPSWQVLLLTFLCTLLIGPAINLTGYLNEQFVLPQSLQPLYQWMRTTEDAADELTKTLLSGNGLGVLTANLIVIALTAAVSEEFLFRGALMTIFNQWIRNHHHITIWVIAIVFSAIHLQFFGFIPRMFLGAFLGYLVYWGKNIWVPIFAHFINNAVAVIGMSSDKLKDNDYVTGEIKPEELLPFTILAIVCLILFYFCIRRLRKELS